MLTEESYQELDADAGKEVRRSRLLWQSDRLQTVTIRKKEKEPLLMNFGKVRRGTRNAQRYSNPVN